MADFFIYYINRPFLVIIRTFTLTILQYASDLRLTLIAISLSIATAYRIEFLGTTSLRINLCTIEALSIKFFRMIQYILNIRDTIIPGFARFRIPIVPATGI